MTTHNRIKQLEKKLSLKRGKVPRHDMVHHVFTGDPNYMAKATEIRKRVREKYGTTNGLIIIFTAIPDPSPLPDFLKMKVKEMREDQL